MTIRQVFRCRACSSEQGPFATQPFDARTGNGHQIMVCPRCETLSVARLIAHVPQSTCATCHGALEVFAGGCPRCGFHDAGFELVIPGLPD